MNKTGDIRTRNHLKIIKKLAEVAKSLFWCLSLSWSASIFYTTIRISCGVIIPSLTIGTAFIGKHIINTLTKLTHADTDGMRLIYLLAGLLLIAVTRTTIQTTMRYCQSMHEDMLKGKMSLNIIDRSLAIDMECFDNPKYHDKLMSMNQDSGAVTGILWNTLNCISSAISFIGAFVILCQENTIYGIVVLITSFSSSIVATKYKKSLHNLNLDQLNGQRRLNYYQYISTERAYAQDLRLFNSREIIKKRYYSTWNKQFIPKRNMIRKRTVYIRLLELLPEVAAALIGVDISMRVIGGYATVGDYSLYTGLIGQLIAAVTALSYSVIEIYDNQMKIDNIKTIDTFANNVSNYGRKKLDKISSIEFINVCFSYPGTKTYAIDNINFIIVKEKKVALVGLNGSGKTTLIKLMLRMYDPDSGTILVNGIDIKEYDLTSIRDNFSVYFQDMRNYSFTLRENFLFTDGNRKDDDKDIEKALSSACCEEIPNISHKGLDVELTRFFESDGIELSVGQHQKLAIARALYRQHTVLILDEPASSLDPKAEHTIFENLKRYTEGKMTIFTSHRLANVFLADRIIVLEKGRIIEDGTQSQLIKNQKRYAELFKYQKEKYMETGE